MYLLKQLDPFRMGLDLSMVLYLALRERVLHHLLSNADRQGQRLSESCLGVSVLRSRRSKGASADPTEKVEEKAAAAGRREKEGRRSVQRERRTEKIVHLTTEMDDEDLQVGFGG
ncbi:hypothetical protein Scep_002021 [Stephania cephalantha]|uniref:Uncharacterized protein n=1 Tax=Stephania cephalantha TaxID=152367 RepID=A0AAP0LBX3_9MAGN